MKYEKHITLKNNKPCLIRNAVGDDAQAILDVFLDTNEQTDYLAFYRDEAHFDAESERKFLIGKEASDKNVFLCAVVDGRIVGTAGVDRKGNSKVNHRAEFSVAIDSEYWGVGIGRALSASCIECAKSAGYDQLELEVVGDNAAAVSLYKSLGFIEYGRNPKGMKSRYCGYQELISMRLELA